LVVGAVQPTGQELADAITRWRVVRDGGNPMSGDEVADALQSIGFGDLHMLPVPPFVPGTGLVAGRR
jgi:hypothetical protein